MRLEHSCGRIQLNSDKHKPANASGNALIYVLLALALLAGLTMVLSRGASTGGDNLDVERAELATTRMTAYAGAAKGVIDQMMMSGSNMNNLDFVRPNQASFDTGVHIHKIHHPAGGGLTRGEASPDMFITATDTPLPGWYFTDEMNVDWTPTGANDVVLVAYRIHESICANINKKIKGSATIPILYGGMAQAFLTTADGGGGSFLGVNTCADCAGYPSLCVSNPTQTEHTYYNVISAQ